MNIQLTDMPLISYFPFQIWLKDLSSFLQLKLSKVPEKDPVFEGKPKGTNK